MKTNKDAILERPIENIFNLIDEDQNISMESSENAVMSSFADGFFWAGGGGCILVSRVI